MTFECPFPISDHETVTLAHGSGGATAWRLIEELIVPALGNEYLDELHDGAVFPCPGGHLALTTDGYVATPRFFPGGDIGVLAVNGTANDLAMCGARPRHLSLGLVLEEGLPLRELCRILVSIRDACHRANVTVVTGDTKVVERGKADGIFLNTTGIGVRVPEVQLAPRRVRPGDRVLLNGDVGHHGLAVLSQREGVVFEDEIASDTAPLWPLVEGVLSVGQRRVHALRDTTRGGVASVLNEIARGSNCGIEIDVDAIPVQPAIRRACDQLGVDPLAVASGGRFLSFVSPELADEIVQLLREHSLGHDAVDIGEVVEAHRGVVRSAGDGRVLEMGSGEAFPRTC